VWHIEEKLEEFDALCGFVCRHHIPRYMCKDSEMSSAWTSGRGREKKENGKIPYQQNMSKLYRTTTVAVGSHGKKEKKDRYSGNRACKETGQKHAFCNRKVDKHHLEYKGKTSLRPLPLFNMEKQEEERKATGN